MTLILLQHRTTNKQTKKQLWNLGILKSLWSCKGGVIALTLSATAIPLAQKERWIMKRAKGTKWQQKQEKKLKSEKKQTGSWQNVFWVLLEIPLAQGSQVFHQYNTSKLQWSNTFRNIFIFPKSTLKLSISQYTGGLATFSYTKDTMPRGGPEVCTVYP